MPQTKSLITVIIPSTCIAARADSLRRAIFSAHESAPGIVDVLIAANGPNIAPELAAELKNRTDIRYVYFQEGSSPKAIASALHLVDTEYFAFLDDDDELLPGGLKLRHEALHNQPMADIALSNGYLRKNGKDTLLLHHLEKVPSAPLETFFTENWLPSCGALFRRDRIELAYFLDFHPYAEWSWLAFRLALGGKRFCIIDKPTFRVNADTPSSLSKSKAYRKTYVQLYQKMLDKAPPKNIQKILRLRLSQAHHDLSADALSEGELREALRHHLQSLKTLSGWRFFSYSRHIIAAALKKTVFSQR